jgi:bla regulator protein blaR1
MMTELTLFTTLAFHHLTLGALLSLTLWGLLRLGNTSAELRSWLWMTAFLLATLLPFTLLSSDEERVTRPKAEIGSALEAQPQASRAQQRPAVAAVPYPLQRQGWHLPGYLVFSLSPLLKAFLLIWLLGSLWRGFHFALSLTKTRRLLRDCQPLSSELETADDKRRELQAQMSRYAVPELYLSPAMASPLVTGLGTPRIILPLALFRQLSVAQLMPIVLHEQAHIHRKDIWFGLFQEGIAILFWWSPVIRLLNRKIHIERELACDLRAAKQLNSKQYAQSLLDCAKLMIQERRSVLAMGLFNQKKELHYRVGQVLQSKSVGQVNKFWVMALCLGLGATSLQAAQSLSPKIGISEARVDARQYSVLPQTQGQQLIQAVAYNDIQSVRALQNAGVDLDTPVIGDGTALMIAVQRGNMAMVEALLELGVNVDQPSKGDGNPLIVAAMHNRLAIAELLLKQGADVNYIVPRDETPLINATRRGLLDMTKLLVRHGADVNLAVRTGIEDGSVVRSPFNMARRPEIREFLLQQGATLDGVLPDAP